MLFTVVSKPSSQWFCLVQPPKHSCLKSVPKHEWKRSSHTQSVSVFRRGVTALSSQILFLCFLGFCFPSGHDTFSVPIGHLFPIFGAELNGTFLVTPVYLHRGAPFLSLGRSLNGTFLVTLVYLHRGAPSFALGCHARAALKQLSCHVRAALKHEVSCHVRAMPCHVLHALKLETSVLSRPRCTETTTVLSRPSCTKKTSALSRPSYTETTNVLSRPCCNNKCPVTSELHWKKRQVSRLSLPLWYGNRARKLNFQRCPRTDPKSKHWFMTSFFNHRRIQLRNRSQKTVS